MMGDFDHCYHSWPSSAAAAAAAAAYCNLQHSYTRRNHCQNMSWLLPAEEQTLAPLHNEDPPPPPPPPPTTTTPHGVPGYHFTNSMSPSSVMLSNNQCFLPHQHPHHDHNPSYGAISQQQTESYPGFAPTSNMPFLSPIFPSDQDHSMSSYTYDATPMMQYRDLAMAYTPLTLYNTGGETGFLGYSSSQAILQGQENQAESLNTSSPAESFDLASPCSSESDWQVVDLGENAVVVGLVSNPSLSLHTLQHETSPPADHFTFVSNSQPIASSPTVEIKQQSPGTPPQGYTLATSFNNDTGHSRLPSDSCFTPSCSTGSSTSESPQLPTPSPEWCQPNLKRKVVPAKVKKSWVKVKNAAVKKETPGTTRRKGGRQGPLLAEQRRGAGEIRKIRACLRCKFLKKTCDTGDVCSGCKPSHARLWQVPCTRVDVRDLGYFLKGWNADCDWEHRVKWAEGLCTFSSDTRNQWFSHDLGFVCDIGTREVYLETDIQGIFNVRWIDHTDLKHPLAQEINTANLTVVEEGISRLALSEYLDRHIEGHFEGDQKSFKKVMKWMFGAGNDTCFMRQVLSTTFLYYQRTKLPLVHKALKFVLAYNLTNRVLLIHPEEVIPGKVEDERSEKYGRTIAPALINFKMKLALSEMWRELHKEVLDGLSKLYTGVYNGDKVKNWPTIFVVSYLLLAVWEEMQFDTHYRKDTPEDKAYIKQFLKDMEIPTGVILGLFAAISQKLPALREWDTKRHGAVLNNDPASCETLSKLQFYAKDQGMHYLVPAL